MSIAIFLVLNGLGVIFLLYVLANFWREGHRPVNPENEGYCEPTMEFCQRERTAPVTRTESISISAREGLSMIPFQGRGLSSDRPTRRTNLPEALEMRLRRFSTR